MLVMPLSVGKVFVSCFSATKKIVADQKVDYFKKTATIFSGNWGKSNQKRYRQKSIKKIEIVGTLKFESYKSKQESLDWYFQASCWALCQWVFFLSQSRHWCLCTISEFQIQIPRMVHTSLFSGHNKQEPLFPAIPSWQVRSQQTICGWM